MKRKFELRENDKIFCTGAFLQPLEIEVRGVKQWRWVLVGSEDPSYFNGQEIQIYDYANDLQGLLIDEE